MANNVLPAVTAATADIFNTAFGANSMYGLPVPSKQSPGALVEERPSTQGVLAVLPELAGTLICAMGHTLEPLLL